MAADGTKSLKCVLFNYDSNFLDNYKWIGAQLASPTADYNVASYTHVRLKIRAADGFGMIRMGLDIGNKSVALHDPDYSPDGLSIDDKKWRTLYIPFQDLNPQGTKLSRVAFYSHSVKPIIVYIDSLAFIKASSSTIKPYTNFPLLPSFSTERTSNYYGFEYSTNGQIVTVNSNPSNTGNQNTGNQNTGNQNTGNQNTGTQTNIPTNTQEESNLGVTKTITSAILLSIIYLLI